MEKLSQNCVTFSQADYAFMHLFRKIQFSFGNRAGITYQTQEIPNQKTHIFRINVKKPDGEYQFTYNEEEEKFFLKDNSEENAQDKELDYSSAYELSHEITTILKNETQKDATAIAQKIQEQIKNVFTK
ncbi:hypothetical protein IJM86_02505 [bacterium]|nr:hypothetical protein [bacterium]